MLSTLLSLSLCALSVQASKYFFVFGDSYTSNAFDLSGDKPADYPGNQMGNPAPGLHTSCGDGCLNWIETLTVKYSPGNYLAYDFAKNGAYISQDAINGSTGRDYELSWQVEKFLANLATNPRPSYAQWNADNSVALLWFGTNDFLSITPDNIDNGKAPEATKTVITTRINNDLNSAMLNVATLYAAGLRNFVILGCPPVDRSAGFTLTARSKSAIGNITYFNGAFQYYGAYFANLYPGSKIVIKDPKVYWDQIQQAGKDPWNDILHPSAPVHSAVAYGVRGILQSDPFNFY